MSDPTPTLTDEQREEIAAALAGHSLNTLSHDSGRHCVCRSDSRFEQDGGDMPWGSINDHRADVLAPLIARMVAEAEQRGRAAALRSPYDEDGYCEGCGNGSWKPHAPECGWADLHDAEQRGRAEGWDERSEARPQYLGPLDGHYPDCMGYGDCHCGTYPNPYRAAEVTP